MLLTKTATFKWSNTIKKYYTEKGYKFTGYGTEFEVDIHDVPKSNRYPIEYICDYCLEEGVQNIIKLSWCSYCKHDRTIIKKDSCLKHHGLKNKELGKVNTHIKNRYSKNEIMQLYLELYNKLNVIPKIKHIHNESKENKLFPSLREITNKFGTLNKLKKACGLDTRDKAYTRDELLNLLKSYIINNNKKIVDIKRTNFDKEVNCLPIYNTYIREFGDDLVTILELCGYKLTYKEQYVINSRFNKIPMISKEEAIKRIKNMRSQLFRPLKYDDFRNPQYDTVSISTIKKYWGTVNNMKKELGLIINQESMTDKHKSLEDCKNDIRTLCDYIYKTEDRKTITTSDTNKIDSLLTFGTYRKTLKEHNINIREYIQSLGFKLQNEGVGLQYRFNDGEFTKSKYELMFSRYLRDTLHLQYNKDYFRDVRYNTFIPNYHNLLDCDYVIYYNNHVIYIEIAGMLRDLHNHYYNNTKITTSKTKEHYRLKLIQKEKMLKENNLEYHIIFPINKGYKSTLDKTLIDGIFDI